MRVRIEQSSRKLEEIQKSFETRIVAVTRQIDDVSIRQALPGLGQKVYVTYNGNPWRNPAEKKADEKWVNASIDTTSWPGISAEQVKKSRTRNEEARTHSFVGQVWARRSLFVRLWIVG